MNKPYFAKWLPVEGEIKEGDYFLNDNKPSIHQFLSSKEKLGTYKIIQGYEGEAGKIYQYHIVQHLGGINKKIRLFLCSRGPEGLKAGDTVFSMERPKETPLSTWIIDDKQIFLGQLSGTIYATGRLIGEISKEALWVKEGDEFTENEVQFHYNHRKFRDKDFIHDGPYSFDWDEDPEKYYLSIHIKCDKCNTFH
jgi:hypothetical protein